jgi:hypothetical protein
VRKTSSILSAIGLAMIACAGWKAQDLRPIVNPAIREQSLDIHESSATASLVGQFRSSVSGWLWLRADLYLHNGVEMRPISADEQKRGVTVEDAKEDGHEKLHSESVVTSIPPKERDFRGIFGDIERNVAGTMDMHEHDHNDPSVAMPLYRLMTWIDPQFVQGWTMGGMILARDRTEQGTGESIAFLGEGWKANPTSVDLPGQIGYTIARRGGDLQTAAKYLEAARSLGKARLKQLCDEEREGLRTAYHFLPLCYRDLGQHGLEETVLREGITFFPDDALLPKLLQRIKH